MFLALRNYNIYALYVYVMSVGVELQNM